jgi:hypothetical protein
MHGFWQLVVLAAPFALIGALVWYLAVTLGSSRRA